MYMMHLERHQLSIYLIISELISEYNCKQYSMKLYSMKQKLCFYSIVEKTCAIVKKCDRNNK